MRGKALIVCGVLLGVVGCGSGHRAPDPEGDAVAKQCTSDPVSRAAFFDTLRLQDPSLYRQALSRLHQDCPSVKVLSPNDAITNDLQSQPAG